ncbi:MAG: hypothetical protein ABI947_12840 [Chloroflexota bacterium]
MDLKGINFKLLSDTEGATLGYRIIKAMGLDSDLAFGLMIEELRNTPLGGDPNESIKNAARKLAEQPDDSALMRGIANDDKSG